jgi:hypothetical protein
VKTLGAIVLMLLISSVLAAVASVLCVGLILMVVTP